jgi:hypothetical protein
LRIKPRYSDRAPSANTIEARRIDSINRPDVRLQSILFTNTHLAYGRCPCKKFLNCQGLPGRTQNQGIQGMLLQDTAEMSLIMNNGSNPPGCICDPPNPIPELVICKYRLYWP